MIGLGNANQRHTDFASGFVVDVFVELIVVEKLLHGFLVVKLNGLFAVAPVQTARSRATLPRTPAQKVL
jgi:hypothetical protein